MVGESRTPESSLTLARLIRGAGPGLVTDPLLQIIASNTCNKRKPAAIDGITYALLIFPRDDFEIEKIGEAVRKKSYTFVCFLRKLGFISKWVALKVFQVVAGLRIIDELHAFVPYSPPSQSTKPKTKRIYGYIYNLL